MAVDVTALVHGLVARGLTIATAESLTGGALCARLVDVAGASETVRGGVCTYATDLKASVLGVPQERLARTGPVDREVALDMARGAARLAGSTRTHGAALEGGPEAAGEAGQARRGPTPRRAGPRSSDKRAFPSLRRPGRQNPG